MSAGWGGALIFVVSHSCEVVQGDHGHEAILWNMVWVETCCVHWYERVAHTCFYLGGDKGSARRACQTGQRAKRVASCCEVCPLVGARGDLESVDALTVVPCRESRGRGAVLSEDCGSLLVPLPATHVLPSSSASSTASVASTVAATKAVCVAAGSTWVRWVPQCVRCCRCPFVVWRDCCMSCGAWLSLVA